MEANQSVVPLIQDDVTATLRAQLAAYDQRKKEALSSSSFAANFAAAKRDVREAWRSGDTVALSKAEENLRQLKLSFQPIPAEVKEYTCGRKGHGTDNLGTKCDICCMYRMTPADS